MKPIVAAAVAALVIPSALSAQSAPAAATQASAAAKPMSGGEVPGWMRALDMTADQRAAIARIHHEAHAKMDAAKKQWAAAGKSPDKDPALKAEMQQMMDAEHAAFREALSPATRPAYDAALKAHMGAEHGGMKPGAEHGGMKHGAAKPPAGRR